MTAGGERYTAEAGLAAAPTLSPPHIPPTGENSGDAKSRIHTPGAVRARSAEPPQKLPAAAARADSGGGKMLSGHRSGFIVRSAADSSRRSHGGRTRLGKKPATMPHTDHSENLRVQEDNSTGLRRLSSNGLYSWQLCYRVLVTAADGPKDDLEVNRADDRDEHCSPPETLKQCTAHSAEAPAS